MHIVHTAVLSAALALALGAEPMAAQGTALVPLSDPAYHALDRLAELLPLRPYITGQRPYSERELCRLSSVARAVPGDERGLREGLISVLGAHCTPRLLGSELALTVASTDAFRRRIPGSFGAQVEATIGSMGTRRLGTPLRAGQSLALELAQRVQPRSWLAANVRGRVEAHRAQDMASSGRYAELLSASVRARAGNVALLVGREQIAWGQRAGDGLFLASDAPALDQVAISGDRPFRLPGFLRALGPTQGTVLLADLGPSVSHSHSKLLAYKVSVSPRSSIEFGGTFFNHFGGQGAIPAGPLDRLIDFLPFIDLFRRHNYHDLTRPLNLESDKVIGIDGRIRLDELRGVVLSGEWLVDDFDVFKLPRLLTYLGSHTLAVTVPHVGSPVLSATVSAKHMGLLTATHNALHNGSATHGRLLGDELGPDAKAFALRLAWTPSAAMRVDLEGRAAIYSNGRYSATYADSSLTRYVFRTVSRQPNEMRERLLMSGSWCATSATCLTARGAAERVRNASSTNARRRDYLVELGVHVRP